MVVDMPVRLSWRTGRGRVVWQQRPPIAILALLVILLLAGCSSPLAASSGDNGPAGVEGAAGGGDEPNVPYVDPEGQFSFSHPKSWGQTTQAGERIRFAGRDEFISVNIVTTALGPVEFAKTDGAALAATSPGFKGSGIKVQRMAGGDGAMVAYTWQAGPSAVTGKLVPSSANRYYIPGHSGHLAVFTYSGPTSNYDPAGADDFANTFKWLK